jgi:hypothetical protein
MSLTTFSTFYYNFEFTDNNRYLNFDEGSGELTADLQLGAVSATDAATVVQDALNIAGTFTYVVTFNRDSRSFTISSGDGNFDLLVSTGTTGSPAWSVIGFSGSDKTGAASYTGGVAGSEYVPQFVLQDHVSTDNFQALVEPSINKTSSGKVEVIRFGTEKFLQANIKYITNITGAQDNRVIRNNSSGVEDAQDFMQYAITKKPIEYMADIGSRSTFQTFILESTPESQNGTSYRLKELYGQGLPNFFETGPLTFRLIE